MKYILKFQKGLLAGKTFELTADKQLSAGRSQSSDIFINSADVSGRHLAIRLTKANAVVVEVFSKHTTLFNGKPLAMGDCVELSSGDEIQLGGSNSFVLEKASGDALDDNVSTAMDNVTVPPKNAPKPLNDDSVGTVLEPAKPIAKSAPAPAKNNTQAPAPKPAADAKKAPATKADAKDKSEKGGSETVAIQTLLASDEELEKIRGVYKTKYRKKGGLLIVTVAIFLALTVSLYVVLRPQREEYLSWPKDASGKFLTDFKTMASYLAVAFPELDGNQIVEKDGYLEIHTAIGKDCDVPLNIYAQTKADKSSLTVSRDAAFKAFLADLVNKDDSLTISSTSEMVFINTNLGSGVPVNRVSYTRTDKGDAFFGYIIYLRFEDNVHSIMAEVPLASQWRAIPFFRTNLGSLVVFAPKRVPEYWEGSSSYRADTTIEQDFTEAKNFQKRKAAVYWENIHYCLQSILIKAKQNNDKESLELAKSMLIKLRDEQRGWYNTQKLAYQYARLKQDKSTMQSIQSTSAAVFTPEFQQSDYRYELIKRKDWR